MKSYYTKIQSQVTDLESTSVAGGILWSTSSLLENLYVKIDEIVKQSFMQTAEGLYLDRFIYGTFRLPRNQETRAFGYVVLHSTSPSQTPQDLRLWCAGYDPSTDTLTNTDKAIKFVSSGSEKEAGRVFVLVEPKGATLKAEEGQSYIDMNGKYVQFIVVPVVSMTKGNNVNVPEGAITVITSNIQGITGVINSYSPLSAFFDTPTQTPLSSRVTSIVGISTTSVDVVNAYNFSNSGLVGFETFDGKPIRGFYQGAYEDTPSVIVAEVVKNVQLEYSDASTRNITISDENFNNGIHTFVKPTSNGRSIVYKLVDAWVGSNRPIRTPELYVIDIISLIESKLVSNTPMLVRQEEAEIDRTIIYDPDNVINDRGVMIDSARIGGGANIESDEDYRNKAVKYLASLSKATPTALEAGALTVPGIAFAKTLPTYASPRGTATLLISGPNGSVNSFQIYQVKKALEENWKAAGPGLIIKTPQKLEVTALVRVSVDSGYSEYMVEPAIRYAISEYFKEKLPGGTISPDELTSKILDVPGVKNVWNIFIGRKLGDYLFRQSNRLEKLVNTGNKGREVSGIKLSTVYTLFKEEVDLNSKLIVEKTGDIDAGVTQIMNQYKVYTIPREANGEKKIIEIIRNFNPQSWQDLGSDSIVYKFQRINNVQEFEKFLGDYVYRSLPKFPMYEITRHLSEPLDIRDRLSLPINFGSMKADMLKPYKLDTVEVPIVGTFRTDKEILPLIGVEFTK